MLAAASCANAAVCTFNVTTGSAVATTTLPELLSCYLAVPLNASTARQTLETARAVLDSYSYTDLLRETGQPWNQRIDAYGALPNIASAVEAGLNGSTTPGAITTDFEMHEAIGSLFGSFNDAHTQVGKRIFDSQVVVHIFTASKLTGAPIVVAPTRAPVAFLITQFPLTPLSACFFVSFAVL